MLVLNARFLAALRLGRSSAASTARITMTTNSSISVNARQRIFIGYFGSSAHETSEHAHCQAIFRPKRPMSVAQGGEKSVKQTRASSISRFAQAPIMKVHVLVSIRIV